MKRRHTFALLFGLMLLPLIAVADDKPSQTGEGRAPLPQEQEPGKIVVKRTDGVQYEQKIVLSSGELSNLIKQAGETLKRFAASPEAIIPPSAFSSAECIAVFPGVVKAALVVGGTTGDGVVTCRGPKGQWSRLGFVNMYGGSLGAQVGVKATDLVLLFMSKRAQEALERGKFSLGADVSATAGSVDKGVELQPSSDVLSYALQDGLFAGASVSGTRVEADEEALKEFYEENADFKRVLTTYRDDDKVVVKDFILLMPKS